MVVQVPPVRAVGARGPVYAIVANGTVVLSYRRRARAGVAGRIDAIYASKGRAALPAEVAGGNMCD